VLPTLENLIMNNATKFAVALLFWLAIGSAAIATSTYDGSWSLTFVTQRGACDPSYDFVVNISDGIVSHPNLSRN
jgi:hypothetical protein